MIQTGRRSYDADRTADFFDPGAASGAAPVWWAGDPGGWGGAEADAPFPDESPAALTGSPGIFTGAGRLSPGGDPAQGDHRPRQPPACAKGPLPLAGGYHHPGLRRHCQRRQLPAAGVLCPLPRVHRQLDTSPNHIPLYNIAQGKCLSARCWRSCFDNRPCRDGVRLFGKAAKSRKALPVHTRTGSAFG